jgi:hypothetical protein
MISDPRLTDVKFSFSKMICTEIYLFSVEQFLRLKNQKVTNLLVFCFRSENIVNFQ